MRGRGFSFKKLPPTEQISLVQPVSLYKSFYYAQQTFYLVVRNKKSRKLYYWDNAHWRKSNLPRSSEILEATSPLDFLVCTGHSFRCSVEEDFGLEYIETEEEIQKQKEMESANSQGSGSTAS